MPSHDRICRARCRLYPSAKPPDDVRHCLRYDLRGEDTTLGPWHALTREQRRKVRRRLLGLALNAERCAGWAADTRTEAMWNSEAAAYRAALEALRP
mgnify:CR=1 FL=1